MLACRACVSYFARVAVPAQKHNNADLLLPLGQGPDHHVPQVPQNVYKRWCGGGAVAVNICQSMLNLAGTCLKFGLLIMLGLLGMLGAVSAA